MPGMLYFGGALNHAVLGLPAYVFVMLALVLAVVAVNVVFYIFMWAPLKNLQGLYHAFTRKENAVFTFDENLVFVLKSEKRGKLIYNESIPDAKAAQPDWEVSASGQLGRVAVDLLFDPFGWSTLGTPERAKIDACVQAWNDSQAGQEKKDEIHTLLKFSRYLHERKVKCDIAPTFQVSWLRIYSAFPQQRLKSSWAGYLRQLAEQLNADKASDLSMIGVYLLIFAGVIDVVLICTKVFHLM